MQAEAEALDAYCDPSPGSDVENNPSFVSAEDAGVRQALRPGGTAGSKHARRSGGGWGRCGSCMARLPRDIRQFYAGDYPALRLSGTLSSLEQVEQGTATHQAGAVVAEEHIGALQLTQNRQLLPTAWLNLAAVAIRASSIDEAQQAMQTAQAGAGRKRGGNCCPSHFGGGRNRLADVYLDAESRTRRSKLLDQHSANMRARKTRCIVRNLRCLRAGSSRWSKVTLKPRAGVCSRRAGTGTAEQQGGPETIAQAQQNRGTSTQCWWVFGWRGATGEEALALWQRYRLRILGVPVVPCADGGLDCLKSKLQSALERRGSGRRCWGRCAAG